MMRKKPDLKLNIPSYPHDYVEMPPETRRLILEANRTPNDIKYIDEDEEGPSVSFRIGSPTSIGSPTELRSPTPEVKFAEPVEITTKDGITDNNVTIGSDSPVVYRKLKRASISMPDRIKTFAGTQKEDINVSFIATDFSFKLFIYKMRT